MLGLKTVTYFKPKIVTYARFENHFMLGIEITPSIPNCLSVLIGTQILRNA
jgi:hypothetical protein